MSHHFLLFQILNPLELKSKILTNFANNVNNLFLMSIEIMFYTSCRLRLYYISFIQTFIQINLWIILITFFNNAINNYCQHVEFNQSI